MEQRKTINISSQLHKFLDKFGNRKETYENIIWRLILNKKLDDEDKKIIKEAKKNYDQFL